MITTVTPPKVTVRRARRTEPLENGERLTAPEFLRRYEAMPQVKKAELIEGVVYMGSPVRTDVHAEPDNLVQTWLGTYAVATPGVKAGGNGTVRLDIDNVPQPDVVLRITAECGGSSRIDQQGYLVGPPELVAEIAASSASIDLHEKLGAYRRNGVQEYLVWRTLEKEFDWFCLVEGVYRRRTPGAKGLGSSVTFPGLILNVPALLDHNGAGVLASLHAGLRSQAHRKFALKLAATKSLVTRGVGRTKSGE